MERTGGGVHEHASPRCIASWIADTLGSVPRKEHQACSTVKCCGRLSFINTCVPRSRDRKGLNHKIFGEEFSRPLLPDHIKTLYPYSAYSASHYPYLKGIYIEILFIFDFIPLTDRKENGLPRTSAQIASPLPTRSTIVIFSVKVATWRFIG